jgi:uncharacterized membrane protein YdbT with pleckstrin-like domain
MTVHPSAKLLIPCYVLSGLVAVGVAIYISNRPQDQPAQYWLCLIPAIILIWTASVHLRRSLIRLHLEEFRLRYESGFISKSTRMMELRKVQDIRVNQSMIQRMLNTGDLSIETAGESSRLVMLNIDKPQSVADQILEASHAHYKADHSGQPPAGGGTV